MTLQQQSLPPEDPVDARSGQRYTPGDGASLAPPGGMPMKTVEPLAKRIAKVRARMPLYIHRRYLVRSDRTGERFYFEIAFLTAKRWQRSAWSVSPAWRSLSLGPFLVAWSFAF